MRINREIKSIKLFESSSLRINREIKSIKLFDSNYFIDDIQLYIDDWVKLIRNKFKSNKNHYVIDHEQISYVVTRLDDKTFT